MNLRPTVMRIVRAVAVVALFLAPATTRAQTSAFSATVVVPGLPSPFIADWERNPQVATLVVNYTGNTATSFNLSAEVNGASRGVISRATSGPYSIGRGPSTQMISSTQLNCFAAENVKSFVEQIVRTGVIPEDKYTLTIRVLTTTGAEVARASQTFSISLPDPPRLVYPTDASTVPTAQPNFQWSAVQAPVEMGLAYRIRVTEVLPQQTFDVALAANRPNLDQTVTGAVSLLYPIDALALEEGKRYVWRVEAVDAAGNPVTSARRRSETFSFTRSSITGAASPGTDSLLPEPSRAAIPDTVILIPGVAQLLGVRAAGRADGTRVTYSGSARLELLAPTSQSAQVGLEGLAIDVSSQPTPSLLAGNFGGQLGAGLRVAPFVNLRSVNFSVATGMRFTSELALAGGSIPLTGDVILTPAGPMGTLTATPASLATLRAFTSGNVTITLTSASVTLPGGTTELRGKVTFFGTNEGCKDVPLSVDAAGALSVSLACAPGTAIPLVGGAGAPTLTLDRVDGSAQIDGLAGTLAPTVTLSGTVNLPGTSCGALVEFTVNSASANVTSSTPKCAAGGAPLDFGWLKIAFHGLTVEALRYAPGPGFTFAFAVSTQPMIPALGTLNLARMDGRMTNAGWTVAGTSASPQVFQLSGFSYAAQTMNGSAGNRSWTATGDEGFEFAMTGRLAPERASAGALACLSRAATAPARISGGAITVDMSAAQLPSPCELALADGGKLQFQAVSGSLVARLSDTLSLTQAPSMTGALTLPRTFECTAPISVPGLSIMPDARVRARITGVNPGCALDLMALGFTIAGGTLDVDVGGDTTVVRLSGGGSASFGGPPVAANGTVAADLVAGTVATNGVTFAGPFALSMPRKAAVLSFTVPGAALDSLGLRIDGRGSIAIGARSIGVTFNQLLLDTRTLAIASGAAQFDATFGLAGSVSDSTKVTWSAVEPGAAVGAATAFRLDLPAGSALTSQGIVVTGRSNASLAWDKVTLASIGAGFVDSTTFAVSPFGVSRGTVEFQQYGQRLAFVDPSGFHADKITVASAQLPAQLGLPATTVAFLDIANSDTTGFRTDRRTDGTMRLYTLPGRSIPLAVPAFGAGAGAVPATVDVVLDATGASVASGSVRAAMAARNLSPTGLPFVVDSVEFGGGIGALAWTVAGRPVFFGAPRGAVGVAHLGLDANGTVSGNVSVATSDRFTAIPGQRTIAINLVGTTLGVSYSPATANGTFLYEVSAGIDLTLGGQANYGLALTWRVDGAGTTLGTLKQSGTPTPPTAFGPLNVALERIRVQRLAPVGTAWDVSILADVRLGFDAFRLLPPVVVEDAELTRSGLTIPAFDEPEFKGANGELVGTYQLKPLAARSSGMKLDWFGGAPPAQTAVSVDVELSFPGAAGDLKNVGLTVLDAKPVNGFLSGNIEPRVLPTPLDVPLADGSTLLRITELGGTLGQNPNVSLNSSLVLASNLRCAAAPSGVLALPAKALTLNATGAISGTATGLAPPCAVGWGTLRMRLAAASLTVGGTAVAQTATLTGTATISIPGATAGDTARGSGQLTVNVSTFVPTSGFITMPATARFRWPLGGASGVGAEFVTRGATFGSAGLTLTGPGALRSGTDSVAAVTFNTLTYGLPGLQVTSGSATTSNALAVDAAIADNGVLTWTLGGKWRAAAQEFRTTIANGAIIDANGITASSISGSRLAWDNRDVTPSAAVMASGSPLQISLAGVGGGRVTMQSGADSVGTIENNEFKPGSLFNTPGTPAKLLLPSEKVGYIALKDAAGTPIAQVTRTSVPGEVAISSMPNRQLNLVIPGLGAGGVFPVTLNSVRVNSKTFALLGGTFEVTPTGAVATQGPLTLTKILYARDSAGVYGLTAEAQVKLPTALNTIPATLTRIGIDDKGFTGTPSVPLTNGAVGSVTLGAGALSVNVTTISTTFAGKSPTVTLNGRVTSPLYGTTTFPITGTASSATWAWTVNFTTQQTISLGRSSLELAPPVAPGVQGVPGVEFVGTDAEVALVTNGIWTNPAFGTSFRYTLSDLRAGTRGYTAGGANGTTQVFKLFGLDFHAKPTPGGITVANGEVRLALAGTVEVLGGTGNFTGLSLGSSGTVANVSNLLTGPVEFQDGAMKVDSLTIASTLTTRIAIKLPDPLDYSGAGKIVTGVNGTIQQKRIELRNDDPGLPKPGNRTEVFGMYLHARGVWLVVNSLNGDNSQVETIADAYLFGAEKNAVHIGTDEGGTVQAGLKLPFSGDLEWGNVELGDSVKVEVGKIAEFLLDEASAPRGKDFELGFNGRMALAIPGGKGSDGKDKNAKAGAAITFADIYVRKGGVDFKDMRINGGTLALANGALVIDVSKVLFKTTPTKISIEKPPEKPTGMPSKAPTEEITVNYVLQFGGSICIQKGGGGGTMSGDEKECTMGGGVEEVLYYILPNGVKNLAIKNANIKIGEALDLQLNFLMTAGAGNTDIAFSGIGTWGSKFKKGKAAGTDRGKEMIVAGAVAIGDVFRVGAFIAVPVEFRIGPVTVEQVGLGFFWNPTADHLRMVRDAAFASTNSAPEEQLTVQGAKFAVFVYGAAAIIEKNIARGRALLMVSDRQVIFDAFVSVTPMEKKITGRLQLTVGIQTAFAEGTLNVTVKQEGILEAAGKVQFYAYSSSAWGVQGTAQVDLFPRSVLGGIIGQSYNGEFFIGPKGFFVALGIEKSFSISSLVSITGGFKAKVWYYAPTADWGGYVALYVDASIAGGLVTANGLLEGALVGTGGQAPTFYLAGTLSASILFIGGVSASVWVSIGPSGFDGGLGSNSGMDAALSKARQVRDEIEASKTEVTGAINQAKQAASSISLSTGELLQVYGAMQTIARSSSFFGMTSLILGEAIGSGVGGVSIDREYMNWYVDMLKGTGLATFDTTGAKAKKDAADAAWQAAQAKQNAAETAVRAITTTVNVAQAAVLSGKIGNPIKAQSFAKPTVTYVVSAAGDSTAKMSGGPSFDLDVNVAQQNVTTATAAKAANDATLARVLTAAQSVDSTLTRVTAATGTSGNSILGALEAFGAARKATEELYAQKLEFLGESQIWTRRMISDALTKQGASAAVQERLGNAMELAAYNYHNGANNNIKGFAMIQGGFLNALLSGRVRLIAAMVGDPNIVTRYNAALAVSWADFLNGMGATSVQWYKDQFNSTGDQLWWRAGYTGLITADTQITRQLGDARADREAKLKPIRDAHSTMTAATDKIFTAQGSLAGVAQDLYTIALGLTTKADQKATINTRLKDLSDGVKSPSMGPVTVKVETSGLTSTIKATWSATHPSKVTEYLYQFDGGLMSNGGNGSLTLTRSLLDVESPQLTEQRNILLWARGGYGYRTSVGRAFTINWPAAATAATPAGKITSVSTPKPPELSTTTTSTTVSGPRDASPPTTPIVRFEGANVYMGYAWAQPASRIRVNWSSTDLESGVSEYEVAVGSTPAATDITPWTSVGLRTDRMINELNLGGGKNIYVSVRAKNSAGLTSLTGTSSALKFDATPPTLTPPQLIPATVPGYPGVTRVLGSCSFAAATPAAAAKPARLFNQAWAGDAESGIYENYWRVSAQPITAWDGPTGWQVGITYATTGVMKVTAPELNYATPVYLNVATMNNAGLVTIKSVGPFTAEDPTGPPAPNACASPGSKAGTISLTFGTELKDPETGIKGYQYRIQKSDGTVARDFPSGQTLDYTNGAGGTYALPGEYSGLYHVDVRAINTLGGFSGGTRGPAFYVDKTPPPAVTTRLTNLKGPVQYFIVFWNVRLPLQQTPPELEVEVVAPGDPESGLSSLEYSLSAGGNFAPIGAPLTTQPGSTASVLRVGIPVSTMQGGTQLDLYVRSRNRAGQVSTATLLKVRIPDLYWQQYP